MERKRLIGNDPVVVVYCREKPKDLLTRIRSHQVCKLVYVWPDANDRCSYNAMIQTVGSSIVVEEPLVNLPHLLLALSYDLYCNHAPIARQMCQLRSMFLQQLIRQ